MLPRPVGENRIQKSGALSRAGHIKNIWKRAERLAASTTIRKGNSSALNVSVIFEKDSSARLGPGRHDVKVAAGRPPPAGRSHSTTTTLRGRFADGFAAAVTSASACWAMTLLG